VKELSAALGTSSADSRPSRGSCISDPDSRSTLGHSIREAPWARYLSRVSQFRCVHCWAFCGWQSEGGSASLRLGFGDTAACQWSCNRGWLLPPHFVLAAKTTAPQMPRRPGRQWCRLGWRQSARPALIAPFKHLADVRLSAAFTDAIYLEQRLLPASRFASNCTAQQRLIPQRCLESFQIPSRRPPCHTPRGLPSDGLLNRRATVSRASSRPSRRSSSKQVNTKEYRRR
jgi:hypothetical protein